MRKILIVEDEEILRDSYHMVLETEPYSVFVAADGAEALKLVKEHTFDLILLDMMMPRVDGLAFLTTCNQEDIALPTVILLSNISSGQDLEKAVALGVRRTAVKADLSPKQLISLVRYELQAT